MKMIHHRLRHWIVMSILSMHLVLGGTAVVHAQEKAESVHKIIEQEFPGATITETERGKWNGLRITEVDFTSQDGVAYEARISDSGRILTIEKD